MKFNLESNSMFQGANNIGLGEGGGGAGGGVYMGHSRLVLPVIDLKYSSKATGEDHIK